MFDCGILDCYTNLLTGAALGFAGGVILWFVIPKRKQFPGASVRAQIIDADVKERRSLPRYTEYRPVQGWQRRR